MFYASMTHAPLIDRDTFDKVQLLLKKRQDVFGKSTTQNIYPLTSRIQCSECGSYFRRRQVSGTVKWGCSKHIQDRTQCGSNYYSEERIYDAFVAMVNKLRFSEYDIMGQTLLRLESAELKRKQKNTAARELSRNIADLNAKLVMVEQLHAKGYLKDEVHKAQVREINDQLRQLKRERQCEFSSGITHMIEELTRLKKLLEELEEPLDRFDEKLFTEMGRFTTGPYGALVATAIHEKIMERQEHQQEREQAFLSQNRDCFAIYQVSRDDPQNVRFMNLDWLKSHDISIDRSNYDLIYTAPLRESGTVPEQLEKLYQQFNLEKPVDFHSPSMSVSDIVAIRQDGKVSCHYCDSVGFTQIPGFLPENPLKNAEMMLEDDYGMIDGIINNGAKEPTVAELEQQARSGQPISLMDLADAVHREEREKKKSVVDQLKSQPKAEHKKTAPKKSAEREF